MRLVCHWQQFNFSEVPLLGHDTRVLCIWTQFIQSFSVLLQVLHLGLLEMTDDLLLVPQ